MNVNGVTVDYHKVSRSSGWNLEKVAGFMSMVRRALKPVTRTFEVTENGSTKSLRVTRMGIGPIVHKLGRFWELEFLINDRWRQYQVLLKAEFDYETLMPIFDARREIIIRPDSGCATGQRFADLTCDYRDQFDLAMEKMQECGQGVLIHIPGQDARGKGLAFKLGTLWIQDVLHVNTVESASMLAEDGLIDVRTYAGAIAILKFLHIPKESKLLLAANNPEKSKIFIENGYNLFAHEPVSARPTKYTRRHFQAKKQLLGHQGLID